MSESSADKRSGPDLPHQPTHHFGAFGGVGWQELAEFFCQMN